MHPVKLINILMKDLYEIEDVEQVYRFLRNTIHTSYPKMDSPVRASLVRYGMESWCFPGEPFVLRKLARFEKERNKKCSNLMCPHRRRGPVWACGQHLKFLKEIGDTTK